MFGYLKVDREQLIDEKITTGNADTSQWQWQSEKQVLYV
jgi:hypothetical protein